VGSRGTSGMVTDDSETFRLAISESPPSFLISRKQGFLLRRYSGRRVKLITHVHFRLRIREAVPPLPHTSSCHAFSSVLQSPVVTVCCFVFGRWRTLRSWRTGLLGVMKWRWGRGLFAWNFGVTRSTALM